MKYDFKTLPYRVGSGAEKYAAMKLKYPYMPDSIVPFSVADMDFLPPEELIDGIREAITNTVFGYTLPLQSYHMSILKWMNKIHHLSLKIEWLLDADNVISSIREIIQNFTVISDGIVILTPVYPAFASSVLVEGRKLYECDLINENGGYRIDFDQLESIFQKNYIKMMIFCNPHNPIGKIWDVQDLLKLAEMCRRYGVFIVSDEIHCDLILSEKEFHSMASLPEVYLNNIAVCTSHNKTFNVSAFKGSIIIMPNDIMRSHLSMHRRISGRDALSFRVCEICYNRCEDWYYELLEVLKQNKRIFSDFMDHKMPEVKYSEIEGTYLAWLDFRCLKLEGKCLEEFLAREANCVFTNGYAFGKAGEGFERMNLACPSSVLTEGLHRIEKALHR